MSRLTPAAEQIAATDPGRSNWVGANAGSGKTHVLTQRVARLLLDGAEPHKILCLTYTRAAASEMQTRLFRTLGGWAMADAAALGQTLADLSGAAAPVTCPARLALARRLFARALETPGGLKIQTIHAFCATMLRRFPLEAGLSPRFEVADDRRARALWADVREELAEAAAEAFDCAARTLNEGDIDALADAVLRLRDCFEGDLEACLEAHFGPNARLTPAEITANALNELDAGRLQSLTDALLSHGCKTEMQLASALDDWLSGQCADPGMACEGMTGVLLTKDGNPRQRGLATKDVLAAFPQAGDDVEWLQDWAARARNGLRAAHVISRVRDLHGFAGALLDRHGAAKAGLGLVDFDDLVACSRFLLSDSVMRAWVLYKLDAGLDHILVDEAQDTAPPQWQVIAAIAEEFFVGAGARPDGRSVFVVGDEKQSIYSFQGAEPRAFGQMRARFAERLRHVGHALGEPKLETSYRSAPAILSFVDAVFAGDAGRGLTVSGEDMRHVAHRGGAYGCVELWPVIEAEPAPEEPEWWQPVDAVPASDTKERLAAAVAGHIGTLLLEGWLEATSKRPARRIAPGDILVLVSRRDRLAAGIIRRLKETGIPVAGADRLVLTRELAVMDLLALVKVCCLRSDELSLAALLRSPLCGLSEEELFELAHERQGGLWQALQDSTHRAVADFLVDMDRHADFLRPYEFLERALVRHDGRRRLIARLGPEAEDAIDELLVQALAYETGEAPTLTGFVHWIEADEIQVRREMDKGAHVRVMTVHGAKGLEAPVVILPDTISGGRPRSGPLLLPAVAEGNRPELMLWAGSKDGDDDVCANARAAADARDDAERRRLLYVALTRAEDRLILCGAGLRTNPKNTWYDMLAAGMDRCAGITTHPSPTGAGEMRRFETGTRPTPAAEAPRAAPAPAPELPAWLCPAPREERLPRVSPSALAPSGAHGGAGVGRDLALRIGEAVHSLLERLPDLPPERRGAAATRLLAGFPDLEDRYRQAALAEAEGVLTMPEAGMLFAPGTLAEAAATMPGPGGARMVGRIDRLVLGPDAVLIVDFKTDRAPPATPAGVPQGYLAQLGAYARAIGAAFPGRAVATALLWTATPTLMRLDAAAAEAAYLAATGPCGPGH